MDFKTQPNQKPSRQPEYEEDQHPRVEARAAVAANSKPKGLQAVVATALVSLLVIIAVFVGVLLWQSKNSDSSILSSSDSSASKEHLDEGKFQAVFLTNGQVYFGKLSNIDQKYITLKNIYYLQVQQSVQPAETKDDPQVSLTKLGEELHGPEDQMNISQDQVLFWENLKDGSTVVKAIKQHEERRMIKVTKL